MEMATATFALSFSPTDCDLTLCLFAALETMGEVEGPEGAGEGAGCCADTEGGLVEVTGGVPLLFGEVRIAVVDGGTSNVPDGETGDALRGGGGVAATMEVEEGGRMMDAVDSPGVDAESGMDATES